MSLLYMVFWSVVMVVALSVLRVRSWRQRFLLCLVTAVVLLVSQSLFLQMSYTLGVDANLALVAPQQYLLRGPMGWMEFLQMSYTLGVDANLALVAPQQYLLRGPMGWMALMVMPCGWLGPFVGLHLTERWGMMVNPMRDA